MMLLTLLGELRCLGDMFTKEVENAWVMVSGFATRLCKSCPLNTSQQSRSSEEGPLTINTFKTGRLAVTSFTCAGVEE